MRDKALNPTRQSGRTTRLVNIYIELLMLTGYVEPKDHFDDNRNHKLITQLVVRRLKDEHPEVWDNCDFTTTSIIGKWAKKWK